MGLLKMSARKHLLYKNVFIEQMNERKFNLNVTHVLEKRNVKNVETK